ncbi:MAG: helix-turn-helix domain-containing protein [Sandaracinaceae bacterium]
MSPQLRVRCTWGEPSSDDAQLMLATMRAEHEVVTEPYRVLVDVRSCKAFDFAGTRGLLSGVWAMRETLAQQVEGCVVMIHPRDLVGSLIAGIVERSPKPFPISWAVEEEQAASQLGHDVGSLLTVCGSLRGRAEQESASEVEVRAWIRAHLATATVDGCAVALGMSTRSLQRRLEELDTSFRHELEVARIGRAQDLLSHPDAKVAAVARTVGYARSQSLSAVFRRHTGLSPSAWRRSGES